MKNVFLNRLLAAVCLIFTAFALQAAAQTTAAAALVQPLEIKLNHDALGKAATVNLQIGGKTYPFLLDTGSGITMISPDLAKCCL